MYDSFLYIHFFLQDYHSLYFFQELFLGGQTFVETEKQRFRAMSIVTAETMRPDPSFIVKALAIINIDIDIRSRSKTVLFVTLMDAPCNPHKCVP
jgi:hypothetical protein